MRYWFGGSPADFVIAAGPQQPVGDMVGYPALLTPGVVLWVWDYDTGERVTDLLDDAGVETTEVVSTDYGRFPRFRGPDGVTRLLIGQQPPPEPDPDAPELYRWTILTTSYPEIVDALTARIAALEADSGGEYVSSAHPLAWTMAEAATQISAHPMANLDGRDQTVTAIRASAAMAAGAELTVTLYIVDLDTDVLTTTETLTLTTATPAQTVTPSWTVPDGAGLTCGLTVVTGEATDVTVQVMVK